MQYRGPLMIEHRLIERMIAVIKGSLERIEKEGRADPAFIDSLVDFIRVYADRTHHGKEEDILFEDLKKRDLQADDAARLEELIQEHVFGRRVTAELEEANEASKRGQAEAVQRIAEKLRTLIDFYPKHIAKEDESFFPAVLKYLSDDDQQALLDAFFEFDRKMIHEKYTSLVEEFEKG